MLFIARDIEQALLETKHSEVVKTRNVEYQALADRLANETQGH
jgi:hypothetical protein